MRVIVVGFGNQGRKRAAVAGADLVGTVDPFAADAQYKDVREVPVGSYDAVMLCSPDNEKNGIIEYCLSQGKHILVEKPLLERAPGDFQRIMALAEAKKVVCYTAYNHRFEPTIIKMRDLIASGELGRIYHVRLFYGNGTAALVRKSPWKDRGYGVLYDLGSHLVDMLLFWFGDLDLIFRLTSANCFENRAYDHITLAADGDIKFQLEMSLISWRNSFLVDVFAERGTAHLSSLCKWGPSQFTHRRRVFPSGRPPETSFQIIGDDPTWKSEYEYFCKICADDGFRGNTRNDEAIAKALTVKGLLPIE